VEQPDDKDYEFIVAFLKAYDMNVKHWKDFTSANTYLDRNFRSVLETTGSGPKLTKAQKTAITKYINSRIKPS
jgi:hypothetical protein